MHIPQMILLSLSLIGLGIDIQRHGEAKTGKHNVFATLIATCIQIGILYWGGFFSR